MKWKNSKRSLKRVNNVNPIGRSDFLTSFYPGEAADGVKASVPSEPSYRGLRDFIATLAPIRHTRALPKSS